MMYAVPISFHKTRVRKKILVNKREETLQGSTFAKNRLTIGNFANIYRRRFVYYVFKKQRLDVRVIRLSIFSMSERLI